ncbi:MAG: DNA/RNA non-specific endonuclease [Saprospiraceae bacterium]
MEQEQPTQLQIQTIVQTSHAEGVLAVAISPDGRYLASASGGDSAVKLWNLKKGTLIRNFPGHSGWVQSIAFSPDGQHLLTGAWDGSAKLWDLQTGKCLHDYFGQHTNAVCFTPDGKVVTGGGSGTAFLWDLFSKAPIRQFTGHTDEIFSVAVSKNGKYLVTGSVDGTAKLWDLNKDGDNLRKTFTHSSPNIVHSVAIDPADDPQYIITTATSKLRHHDGGPLPDQIPPPIKLWNINGPENEAAAHEFTGHAGNVYAVAVSPDGKLLVGGGKDKKIWVWGLKDNRTKTPLQHFEGHTLEVAALCFSPDSDYVASGSFDCLPKLWSIQQKKEIRTFSGHASIVYSSAMSHDGHYLVEGSEGNLINLWDLSKGELANSLNQEKAKDAPWGTIHALDVHPDENLFASGSSDRSVSLWDFTEKKEVKGFTAPHGVSSVRFSEDGKYLAIGSTGSLKLKVGYWDWKTADPVWVFEGEDKWGCHVDINAEKGCLAVALDHDWPDKPDLVLIDFKNGNKQYELQGKHPDRIRAIRMCRHGQFLATACHDGKVRLWDISNLENIHLVKEYRESVWVITVDLSDDGRYILSGGRDNIARLYDTEVPGDKPVHLFEGHTSEVFATFSPDDRYVMTASKDSTTKIWERNTGKEIATLVSLGDTDWAVLTPSGLFDASPGAMKMMHYTYGLETIELDQFKERYWQPRLLPILLKLKTGTLKDVPDFDASELSPVILSAEIINDELVVKIKVRNGGIGCVDFFINKKEITKQYDGEKGEVGFYSSEEYPTFSFDLTQDDYAKYLEPGENTISVQCWNKGYWLHSLPIHLTYKKEKEGQAEAPSLHALFVGTSKYSNDALSLNFPDQDAAYLDGAVRIVGQHLFGDRVHTQLLTTEKPGGATFASKENIKNAFADIAKNANPQDVVIIYFSGHGANSDDNGKAQYYYLTHEVVSSDLRDKVVRERAAISLDELTKWIKDITARKQVVIFDTCYSGKVAELLKSKNAVETTSIQAFDRMKDRTGTFVLAGSAADMVSYEASNYGQGLLTYSLLMGMRGASLYKGTNQRENSVDVLTLFNFSSEEVQRLSKEFSVVQRPTLSLPTPPESFDIGIAPENARRQIKVAMPKPVFERSNFMNLEHYLDDLNISETLDQYMAGSIGIGNRPQAIFLDTVNFPGAHNIRGVYQKKGDEYLLKGKVYKNGNALGDFSITGKGMEDIVPQIGREVEVLVFPIDDYHIPTDEEIGVLEKGREEDLDALKLKGGKSFGYDEDFIGDKFKVKMPELNEKQKKDIAKSIDGEEELKYQYYSVVQSKSRKLPFFAACNLHGGEFRQLGRAGAFIRDPRLPKEDQMDDDFYTYEFKDKNNNEIKYTKIFHRGHMTKREDTQWGQDDGTAELGAKLTFFFTNAVPQHGHLNGVVWKALEDHIMHVATNGKKAKQGEGYKINILTGPVFQDDDPKLPIENGTAQIPALFWKVVYYKKKTENKLYHVGFMMGQKKLMETAFTGHGILAKGKEKTFDKYEDVIQVKVSFIEKMTGMKFHPAEDPLKNATDGQTIHEVIKKPKKKGVAGGMDEPTYGLEGLVL